MKDDISFTIPALISDWLGQSDTVQRRRTKPSVSQQLGAWYQASQACEGDGDRPFGIIVQDDSLVARITQITNKRRQKSHCQPLRIRPRPSLAPHIRNDVSMATAESREIINVAYRRLSRGEPLSIDATKTARTVHACRTATGFAAVAPR